MPKTKMRGLTTVESLLIAAAFIIVGVIGLLTFQGMGKAAAQSLRANAIVTVDKGGFDVTVEVLNGQLSGVLLYYGVSSGTQQSGSTQLTPAMLQYCISKDGQQLASGEQISVIAGQSITCRFQATLSPGSQVTYIVYAVDSQTGKSVQIAKGVVTVGIA